MEYFQVSVPILLLLLFFVRAATSSSSTTNSTDTIEYVRRINATGKIQQGTYFCNYNSQCTIIAGANSKCYNHACICNFGYRSINSYCKKQYCTYDSDCSAYFYGSECSFGSCVCDSGYYVDYYSQTCLHYSSGSGATVGISLGTIIFFIFVGLIIFIVVRRRQQVTRVIVPRAGATAAGGIRTLQQPMARAPPQQAGYQQAAAFPPQTYLNQAPYPQPGPVTAYPNPNYQQPQQVQAPPPPYNPAFAQQPQPNVPYPTSGGKF